MEAIALHFGSHIGNQGDASRAGRQLDTPALWVRLRPPELKTPSSTDRSVSCTAPSTEKQALQVKGQFPLCAYPSYSFRARKTEALWPNG